MSLKAFSSFILFFCISTNVFSQQTPTPTPAPALAPTPSTTTLPSAKLEPLAKDGKDEEVEKPNGRRIRRNINLVVSVEHDEELLIPQREIVVRGRTDFFEIYRIKDTDFFRIKPKKAGNGIVTIHDKATGQTLVELHFDIRDDSIDRVLREVQSLLADIEGIEYKIISGGKDKPIILIDGFVLLPKDLIRIANVIKQFDGSVKNLATLSPLARKKIAEYIAKDVNNPEVSVTAVGEFIKLEGIVNSKDEKDRINRIVGLYIPDIVIDNGGEMDHVKVIGRKTGTKIEDMIIDLIAIKKDEEKTEPPPKMIQVVVHFVEFAESYNKVFNFGFNPSLKTIQSSGSTLTDTANLISNLLPKLNWSKKHGFARILDTASVLTQDKKEANFNQDLTTTELVAGQNGAQQPVSSTATVSLSVVPTIKSERSGLIELPISVVVSDVAGNKTVKSNVKTTISVRDRQSAAFGGLIKKKNSNQYGGDPSVKDAIVTLNQGKEYLKSSSNFVVFVTPIIKSSASSGVDQVKKKFRLRE